MCMSKIYFVYGLENDLFIGQGGYLVEFCSYDGMVFVDCVNVVNIFEVEMQGQFLVLGIFLWEIWVFEEEY